jgi:hypothetical protein
MAAPGQVTRRRVCRYPVRRRGYAARVTYLEVVNRECWNCSDWHTAGLPCPQCGCTEHQMAPEVRPSALYEVFRELEQRRWERYNVAPRRHLWVLFERGGLIAVAIPSGRRIPAEVDPVKGLAKLRGKISRRPTIPARLIAWSGTPAHRRNDPVTALGFSFTDPSPDLPVNYVAGYDIHGTAFWLMRSYTRANHHMDDPDWQAAEAPPVWAPVVRGGFGRNIVIADNQMNYNLLDRAISEVSRVLPSFTGQQVRPWAEWNRRGMTLPMRTPPRSPRITVRVES